MIRSTLLSLALLAALPWAAAAPVLLPPSTIKVSFQEMGVTVDANFTKFTGTIDFDPAKPAAAHVEFTIDITSFDLGNAEYNREVLKPEWFDAAHFPTAHFVSTSLKPLAAGQMQANGKITIKGRTQDVGFVVSTHEQGAQRSYDGVVRIKRNAFGVGTGEWAATDTLADDISITVHAVSSR